MKESSASYTGKEDQGGKGGFDSVQLQLCRLCIFPTSQLYQGMITPMKQHPGALILLEGLTEVVYV